MVNGKHYCLTVLFFIATLFVFCEFLIYYVVIIQCSWPQLDKNKADLNIDADDTTLRVMLLADTHLLGPRRGHWFDKLRREWQMHRAFQSAMALHRPDIVFVLGDLFDEGLWCSDLEFSAYVTRFHSLFRTPEGTELFAVVGNHDIGFHYGVSPYLKKRFSKAFNSQAVQLVSVKGIHFVLVNSMAMEGDGCFLCRPAELQLQRISKKFKCAKNSEQCKQGDELIEYSRPVLLQHFPLYRESDEECNEPDSAPEDQKKHKFREGWECLSRESTDLLFDSLNPRLIVTGHTHHGCSKYYQEYDAFEYTIPSFSWRNKDNPSFMLAVVSQNNFAVSKCYMPQESSVILIYSVGGLGILCYLAAVYRRHWRRSRLFKKTD